MNNESNEPYWPNAESGVLAPERPESEIFAERAGRARDTAAKFVLEADHLERASRRANYRENPGDWIERLLNRVDVLEKQVARLSADLYPNAKPAGPAPGALAKWMEG